MNMQKFGITKDGFNNLKSKLDNFINIERPYILKEIESARELGDLSENTEYSSAKERCAFIDAEITHLSEILENVDVIDIKGYKSDKIEFGATVKLLDLNKNKEVIYQIVGEYESNIEDGKLAVTTPISSALLGKKVDDVIKINTSIKRELKVLQIQYI